MEAPVPADPAAARHWHLQRALALIEFGRTAEARAGLAAIAALRPVPTAVAPLWHWQHALLARAGGDAAGTQAQAGQMAAALEAMGPEGMPGHRIMGHYDLAKNLQRGRRRWHGYAPLGGGPCAAAAHAAVLPR